MKLTGSSPDDINAAKDPDGLFPVPLPPRYNVALPGSRPMPGMLLIQPIQKGNGKGMFPHSVIAFQDPARGQFVGACLHCARKLTGGTQAAAGTWMDLCESWIGKEGPEMFDDMSVAEQRMCSMVALHPTPDLSGGKDSVAGHYSPPAFAKLSPQVANRPVPFCEVQIEALAFPALVGAHGSVGWSAQSDAIFDGGDAVEQLRAYTMLRLYSVNPKWRKNSDYVIFAMQRLAYGNVDYFGPFSHVFLSSTRTPHGCRVTYSACCTLLDGCLIDACTPTHDSLTSQRVRQR